MNRYHIFGENSCEEELNRYAGRYHEYYFDHVPFNSEVMKPGCYVVVGRRGAGKSSLIQYFSFQRELPKATVVTIGGAQLEAMYRHVFDQLKSRDAPPPMAITEVRDHWTAFIWATLFEKFRQVHEDVAAADSLASHRTTFWNALCRTAKGVFRKHVSEEADLFDKAKAFLDDAMIARAREVLLSYFASEPVIVAFDSLEHHALNDDGMMCTLAGLIECASQFNLHHARDGLHVKVFVTDEIYPHLSERFIQNPIKHLRNPVFLHWRPKDLIRLVCWRYNRHLEEMGSRAYQNDIAWDRFRDVVDRVWKPHFGEAVSNRHGRVEQTFW